MNTKLVKADNCKNIESREEEHRRIVAKIKEAGCDVIVINLIHSGCSILVRLDHDLHRSNVPATHGDRSADGSDDVNRQTVGSGDNLDTPANGVM